MIWVGSASLLALAISIPLTGGYVVSGLEGVLRALGVLPALIVATVAADAWLVSRRPNLSRRFFRLLAGAHLAVLFTFGLAGFFTPPWTIGDVAFAEVTAGGNIGKLMAGNVPGVLGWTAIGLTSGGLLWPKGAWFAWQGTCKAGRLVRSFEIPQNAWRAIRAFFTGLVPGEEAPIDEKLLTAPPKNGNGVAQGIDPSAVSIDSDIPLGDPFGDVAPTVAIDHEIPETKVAEPDLPVKSKAKSAKARSRSGWELPPVDLLAEAAEIELRPVDNEIRAKLIVDTLASFGVDSRVVSISQGPTVTQFGVEPGWEVKTKKVQVRDEDGKPVYSKDGTPETRLEVVSRTRVRVNRVTRLANDLSLALAAPTIRIEAPVPGKPIIGIEVPNTTTSLVSLRSVIESKAFHKANNPSKIAIALGKGVSGEPVAADLTKMPHLLIAGATGSGKSVCINSIIGSFLLHNTPEDLRLVLVDPKRVELASFAKIPHLAFSRIIMEPEEIVGTLQAIIHEMDSRYRRFAAAGVRNLEGYNARPDSTHRLPHWVVIIDELADLMMVAPYEVERQLCRLAQLARATGIHLIIATQRPSVDVVTGLINANFPTRIAFAVSSQVDSRTIIDMAGADKLLGRGDMLYMPTDASKPKRLQGSFVSDEDLEKIVAWWTTDRFRHLAPDNFDHLLEEAEADGDEKSDDDDPLLESAKELAAQHTRISTSLLQRRLRVGYPRAARLVDMLEDQGIVGPAEGGQSRIVLSPEEGEEAETDEDFPPADDAEFE